MPDRLRDLWAERPAVVAAVVIAPVAFVVTLLVLFLAVGGGSGDVQQASLAQQAQSEQAQPAQTSASRQTTVVQVETQPSQEQQHADSPSQEQSAQSQAASDQDDATQSGQAQSAQASQQADSQLDQQQAEESTVPAVVAGRTVVALDTVLVDEIDEDSFRHGTDGSEGGILPIDNGVVPSSGPEHQTTWELLIPSAGLKSAVVRVGRTASGAMGSPDNPYVIGWLDSSAEPGETGNTLLAGHRDFEDVSGNVGTGVCWELINTNEGDQMIVRDNERNIYYVYRVTEAVTVNPRDPASARYLKTTDEPVVTLITCTGSFNAETHQYSHRFVVVGVLTAVASPDA